MTVFSVEPRQRVARNNIWWQTRMYCSIEHQPQQTIGLQQLDTATGWQWTTVFIYAMMLQLLSNSLYHVDHVLTHMMTLLATLRHEYLRHIFTDANRISLGILCLWEIFENLRYTSDIRRHNGIDLDVSAQSWPQAFGLMFGLGCW